ncbi:MAG TPA: hypothetical protein VFR23_03960 [Jiangellaceae bacterium]|nr:hypothetical protein [Jiangellaceae bacterium]
MDTGEVILLIVVLLIVAAVAGHLIAQQIWPIRRRIWRQRADLVEAEAKQLHREYDLEKLGTPDDEVVREREEEGERVATTADVYQAQADELEAQAHRERLEAQQAEAEARRLRRTAAGESPPETPERSTPRRRRAGVSPEDLDY